MLLTPGDEGPHPVGPEPNWNESRYVDVVDRAQGIGAWLRMGNRPNEGRAEMSVAVSLPEGRIAFAFERAPLVVNGLASGGQLWEIVDPFVTGRVAYEGSVYLLDDPWDLSDPRRAFASAPRRDCSIELISAGAGWGSVLGSDQAHVERIFLPGQTTHHYQHLVHTTGTICIGDDEFRIAGRGGRDHSWGPRNWHAKIYLRWLIGSCSDDLGLMLTRAVGPTGQTRGGFVWEAGRFHLVDDFTLRTNYGGAPRYEARSVEVSVHSGSRVWDARATAEGWLPLRHTQAGADGEPSTLRIVKSPAKWEIDGHEGEGMLEYHDRMVDGIPAGLVE